MKSGGAGLRYVEKERRSFHEENCRVITSSHKCAIWVVKKIQPVHRLKHLPDGVAQEKKPRRPGWTGRRGGFGRRPQAYGVPGFGGLRRSECWVLTVRIRREW